MVEIINIRLILIEELYSLSEIREEQLR